MRLVVTPVLALSISFALFGCGHFGSSDSPAPSAPQQAIDELLANVDAAIRIEADASQLGVRNTLEAQGATWDPSTPFGASTMIFYFEDVRFLTVEFERAAHVPGQEWAFDRTYDAAQGLTPHDAFNVYAALNARLAEKFGKPYDKHEEVLSPFRPDEQEAAVIQKKVRYFTTYRAGTGYLHISIRGPLIPEEPIEGASIAVEYSYKRPGS